jgi:proposed homoserine kinase
MKHIVILGDGMSDEPIEQLNNATPMEYAKTPTMDELAGQSEVGIVHTIPEGMSPGSDVANLSVLGYDPKQYYSGRSPLEALSIGVKMEDSDVAIRCNIVTLSEDEDSYEDRTMVDHSADEISTEEAAVLLEAVRAKLQDDEFKFYLGTSYRHCLIWKKGEVLEYAQPHDILEQSITKYLPTNDSFLQMQKRSYEILVNHPINQARRDKGLNPANSLWFWGAGTKPSLDCFEEKRGKKGVMISAVDLLKGIAVGAGLHNINVEGANGGLNTNYEGKAKAAVEALTKDGYDFVYVHIEAPDEMGHQGSLEKKIKAIEYLDERVIKVAKEGLDAAGVDYRMIILPDHPTPLRIRTHTSEAVPYLLYDSTDIKQHSWKYNEKEAIASGNEYVSGCALMEHFIG